MMQSNLYPEPNVPEHAAQQVVVVRSGLRPPPDAPKQKRYAQTETL